MQRVSECGQSLCRKDRYWGEACIHFWYYRNNPYWKPQLMHYKELGQFILIDPLGFGQSPKPNVPYTIYNHVQALHQTLKDEGRFTIIGHSMGGLLALHFTVKYPELVSTFMTQKLYHANGMI